ncbi:MAG: NfeD family protein [Nevskia sp.]|jgi:hypothetical protein|nr:NfeD family protein [Nevskia sp.]
MDALLNGGFLFWHWWVLGFLLLALEVLTPGTFCMWIGFAAIATGGLAWLVPTLSLAVEVVLFALLSLISVGLWFKYRPLNRNEPETGLNQRGRGYIGRVLTLNKAIVNGIGQARLEDSVWRVSGPELPSGCHVRVIAVDGTTLHVEKVD